MIYILLCFCSWLPALSNIPCDFCFSAQTGVLAPPHLHKRIAFFLLHVRHIKLFPRVQNFLLMCLRLASQHPSKWRCTGSLSSPLSVCPSSSPSSLPLYTFPYLYNMSLYEDMPINCAGSVSGLYSVVLWIILLLTRFLEGKMIVKLFLGS